MLLLMLNIDNYRRRDIDELECEAINMGGREAPFC